MLREQIAKIRSRHTARSAARAFERQRAVSCRGTPARVPDEMHHVAGLAGEPLFQCLFGRGNYTVESNEVLRLEAFQGIGQILPGAFGVKRRRVGRRGNDRHNAEWLSCPPLRRAAPANAVRHDGCRFPGADAFETATPQPGQKRASGISPRPH